MEKEGYPKPAVAIRAGGVGNSGKNSNSFLKCLFFKSNIGVAYILQRLEVQRTEEKTPMIRS